MDIKNLLDHGLKYQASDILLSPGVKPFFRVDGDLMPGLDFPVLEFAAIRQLIFNLMTDKQIQLFEQSHTLDFVFDYPELDYRFRVNITEQENGLAAALRLIPKNKLTLDELAAPIILKNLLGLSHGLILITGPEGSGKSETLAAMINDINSNQSKHIITIENPIENKFESKKSLIDQCELFEKQSFSDVLRIALRRNPDVLMIGEMQDSDTVSLALNAAETGQLVLSSLHASSAPDAIRRMLDFFPFSEKEVIRHLISTVLQGIVYQRLVKKIAGGRIAAFEVLLGNTATRNLIKKDEMDQLYNVMHFNQELGMCTIQNSLEKLAEKNIISPPMISTE